MYSNTFCFYYSGSKFNFVILCLQIDLIEAETFYMTKRMQAHQGEILFVTTSVGMRRYDDPEIGQFSRLVSAGKDGAICVWEVQRATLDGMLVLINLVKVLQDYFR